jgi:hypothetical protein
MKNTLLIIIGTCCLALLSGCASGPKFAQAKNSIPALGPDQARIYFYRTTALGAAVQPAVKLNEEKIGSAVPKGFFYADRAPGSYQVDTSTEVKRRLSLTLEKGQTRYVRLNIAMGFWVGHVWPELVDEQTGEKEIAKCSLVAEK